MYSQIYYILRSRQDGRHLAARPDGPDSQQTYLLIFQADHEALSYLSVHAPDMRDRFSIESVTAYQFKDTLNHWGFGGIGFVNDPAIPNISFIERSQVM
ncbi:MAG: hypothetical protein ACFBSG_02695 [Leptolyngbyaceae cyanobacterium]